MILLIDAYPIWMKLPTEVFNFIYFPLAILQLLVIWFAAINIRQQKKQIKRLSDQVRLQTEQVRLERESVFVTSFSHFSDSYQRVMNSLPQREDSEVTRRTWWYRYWDVLIAEVNFCMKGYLDRFLFELWMNELARNFNFAPHGAEYMGTFEESCEHHLDRVLPKHHAVRIFFDDIKAYSKIVDERHRAKHINALVDRTYGLLQESPSRL